MMRPPPWTRGKEARVEVLELALMVLACVIGSAVLCQVVPRLSLPLVQIAVGAVVALVVPAVRDVSISSELFLVLFIAPLLFNEAPSMNVYDRKCLLSKKTLSLPAVMRRGLLIVYVYCACKIFDEFHCNSLRYAFCCALRQRFDPTPFACLQVSYRAKLVSESRFLHT